jgi:hypothetical protein
MPSSMVSLFLIRTARAKAITATEISPTSHSAKDHSQNYETTLSRYPNSVSPMVPKLPSNARNLWSWQGSLRGEVPECHSAPVRYPQLMKVL